MRDEHGGRPHVLVLSRNFPNAAFPTLGLWAERLVIAASPIARSTVIAPVPWVPAAVPGARARRFRGIPTERSGPSGRILHPRIPVVPGSRFHAWEARLQWRTVRRVALAVHRQDPVALIHAHFIYPEGVMAARLGRELGVPVVTTEHALWRPWLDDWPQVRRQVVAAAPDLARITVVSEALARTVRGVLGPDAPVELLPNIVDETTFRARVPGEARDLNLLLFVGAVRHVKGLDLLVEALACLRPSHPALRLTVIGEAFYAGWRRDEERVRAHVRHLGLDGVVTFAGRKTPAEVAAAMRSCAMVVVPSRRESFSAVAVEALASGVPVVATRCGGPEEFLSDATGSLVAAEDPGALADGIREVAARLAEFPPTELRVRAVEEYGLEAGTRRLVSLYRSLGFSTNRLAAPGAR